MTSLFYVVLCSNRVFYCVVSFIKDVRVLSTNFLTILTTASSLSVCFARGIPNIRVGKVSVKLANRAGWLRNGVTELTASSDVVPMIAGTALNSPDSKTASGSLGTKGTWAKSPSITGLQGLRLIALPTHVAGSRISSSRPARIILSGDTFRKHSRSSC